MFVVMSVGIGFLMMIPSISLVRKLLSVKVVIKIISPLAQNVEIHTEITVCLM
jgi:hypothetical protein